VFGKKEDDDGEEEEDERRDEKKDEVRDEMNNEERMDEGEKIEVEKQKAEENYEVNKRYGENAKLWDVAKSLLSDISIEDVSIEGELSLERERNEEEEEEKGVIGDGNSVIADCPYQKIEKIVRCFEIFCTMFKNYDAWKDKNIK
jgi:hypothetical protein